MDDSAIRKRIDELLKVPDTDEGGHHLFQGTMNLVSLVYGPDSVLLRDMERVGQGKGGVVYLIQRRTAARGTLENLRGDLDAGVVSNLRAQVAGAVLTDFMAASRAALDESGEGAKNVAAVLAAAVFEDTMRRMASDLAGVVDRPELSDVLQTLKNKGVLQHSEFSIAQMYLQFRNRALHAEWEKVGRESVASCLGFVEQLLVKHFT